MTKMPWQTMSLNRFLLSYVWGYCLYKDTILFTNMFAQQSNFCSMLLNIIVYKALENRLSIL